mmetsp:Transcript_36585/g.80356  ORF Transcript_36585/g.80356 Transcript_36585/m.80356 type:complete len:558 (-) Transcript_36585:46-1719(-)
MGGRGRGKTAGVDGRGGKGGKGGKFTAKGGVGSARPGPLSAEEALSEAEVLIERAERAMRNRESKKAHSQLVQAVEMLREAGVEATSEGSLLLASASGSLLQLDDEERMCQLWKESGAVGETIGKLMGPEQRMAALNMSDAALEQGFAAAGIAGMPLDEQSHMCESRAQVAQLLSEEWERQAEALRGRQTELSKQAMGHAVECATRAVALYEESSRLFLCCQAGAEWEPEPDVDLLNSLGSALMHHGRLLLLAVRHAETDPASSQTAEAQQARKVGQKAVTRSLECFEEACSRCDSAKGDDLSEVLKDWAQALWDASSLVPTAKAEELLRKAAAKAADAIALQMVPLPAYCNLLGDVLCTTAEWARDNPDTRVVTSAAPPATHVSVPATRDVSAGASASDTHGAGLHEPEYAAGAEAALRFYARSLEEGYSRALRVSSRDLRAQMGAADAWLGSARALAAIGDGARAAEALRSCIERYSALLRTDVALWMEQKVPPAERAEARYNAACALALAGNGDECRQLLVSILAEGGATPAEIAMDPDFSALHAEQWWQQLLT